MTFELLASELTNLVDKIANSSYYVISATPLDLKLKEPTPTNMFLQFISQFWHQFYLKFVCH